ncbi:MAG: VanZ family protein [Melioribacteraceae bacterium]
MYKFLKQNRTKVLVIPLIIYWLIILIGTSLPADSFADTIELSDKVKHFVAYLGLAVILGMNLHFQERWKTVRNYYIIITFFICVSYGVVDELHQMFIPNRFAELLDWVADTLGALVGILSVSFFIEKIKKKYIKTSLVE